MATSPFTEVEDVQNVPKQDFVREVSVPPTGWTEIKTQNRCYGVEVWDKALATDCLVKHQANDDTYSETIKGGNMLRKGFEAHQGRRVNDSEAAMRPGALVGHFQSTSGTLTMVVKEVTNAPA